MKQLLIDVALLVERLIEFTTSSSCLEVNLMLLLGHNFLLTLLLIGKLLSFHLLGQTLLTQKSLLVLDLHEFLFLQFLLTNLLVTLGKKCRERPSHACGALCDRSQYAGGTGCI